MTLEGGGQLVRIALGLSSLTRIPIHITAIRGKRSGGGGLKAQHLTSVQWLGRASNARISGAGLKSRQITFTPSAQSTSEALGLEIQQSTPGSVNLVLQAILPYLLFSGSVGGGPLKIRISGGTNVSNSPSVDYVRLVLLPMLEKIGIPRFETSVRSRGWSQGSTRVGSVEYTIPRLTNPLSAFQLTTRGAIKSVKAIVLAPKNCERDVRDELDVAFEKQHRDVFGDRDVADVDVEFEDSGHEKRFYLLLVATTTTGMRLGRDWLYDHGVRAGKVDRVVKSLVGKVMGDLVREVRHGGCVDEYLRDQLVVFQALAEGRSRVCGGRVTDELLGPSLHAKTAQWVVERLLGVGFDEEGGCEGLGFIPGVGVSEKKEKDKEREDLTEKLAKLEMVG